MRDNLLFGQQEHSSRQQQHTAHTTRAVIAPSNQTPQRMAPVGARHTSPPRQAGRDFLALCAVLQTARCFEIYSSMVGVSRHALAFRLRLACNLTIKFGTWYEQVLLFFEYGVARKSRMKMKNRRMTPDCFSNFIPVKIYAETL